MFLSLYEAYKVPDKFSVTHKNDCNYYIKGKELE